MVTKIIAEQHGLYFTLYEANSYRQGKYTIVEQYDQYQLFSNVHKFHVEKIIRVEQFSHLTKAIADAVAKGDFKAIASIKGTETMSQNADWLIDLMGEDYANSDEGAFFYALENIHQNNSRQRWRGAIDVLSDFLLKGKPLNDTLTSLLRYQGSQEFVKLLRTKPRLRSHEMICNAIKLVQSKHWDTH